MGQLKHLQTISKEPVGSSGTDVNAPISSSPPAPKRCPIFVNLLRDFVCYIFPSTSPSQPKEILGSYPPLLTQEEELMAKALHVSVGDLENVVYDLRMLHLLADRSDIIEGRSLMADFSKNNGDGMMHDGSLNQRPVWPSVFIGKVSDRYGKCFKLVGQGTGGTVRLFQRPEDGKVFAVKEFRQRKPKESVKHYAQTLTREYCIGSVLHHPNVIKTIDLIIDSGKFFEVMECCQSDLFHFILNGSYDVEEANCCFKQILQGVTYLHDLGVAHRDLKPENITINDRACLKIIDFGLSDVFKSPNAELKKIKSKGIYGSAPYIAPEEWIKEEYDPQKVDIWSCAVIYMTMIFHAFPWERANRNDKNYKRYVESRQSESKSLFSALPEECRGLIARMLDPDPSGRPSAQQCVDDNWLRSIEVCDNCLAKGKKHRHFASN